MGMCFYALLDHPIRSKQHRLPDRHADPLGGFQIDDELDRQFPWLQQTVWLLNCWSDFADGYVGLNLPE